MPDAGSGGLWSPTARAGLYGRGPGAGRHLPSSDVFSLPSNPVQQTLKVGGMIYAAVPCFFGSGSVLGDSLGASPEEPSCSLEGPLEGPWA